MTVIIQECWEQYWTSPEGSTPQSSWCTTIYHPPITKLSKLDEPDIWVESSWRIKDELISDVLRWTPSHGRTKAGWLERIYTHQLCIDTVGSPEWTIEKGGGKGSGIFRADGTTGWWWWWWSYLPNPSARAGYDTRSIFKRSLAGLNSEFSFS